MGLALTLAPVALGQGQVSSPTGEVDDASTREALRSGAEWLARHRRPDGLFEYGLHPGVNRSLPDDSLLRQAGSAAALARSARILQAPHLRDAALGVVESLLRSCLDSSGSECRFTVSEQQAHPVGFAGLLLWAIVELKEAGAESPRLDHASVRLASYLRQRQRKDGSIALGRTHSDEDDEAEIAYYAGEALYAMARLGAQTKDADLSRRVEKALPYYRSHWRQQLDMAFIPWQSAAYAEAYLSTGRKDLADFVFEMNEWLLVAQYGPDSAPEPEWNGGFSAVQDGQLLGTEPGIDSASYGESLASALKVARAVGDERRAERYESALARTVEFLKSLQFDERKTSHYLPDYQARLLGAFHARSTQGTVRIDFTQHALTAMNGLLER